MGVTDHVKLECRPEAISALAAGLQGFTPIGADPQWLISAVWLAGDADYLATPSTKVQPDGYIARPLAIQRVDEFTDRLAADLPDISSRLVARQSGVRLPDAEHPRRPALSSVPAGEYSMAVLIRICVRSATTHRVACGLLFTFHGGRLLVGTDVGTLAMVLSQDEALIDGYLAACETIPSKDYIDRLAS